MDGIFKIPSYFKFSYFYSKISRETDEAGLDPTCLCTQCIDLYGQLHQQSVNCEHRCTQLRFIDAVDRTGLYTVVYLYKG